LSTFQGCFWLLVSWLIVVLCQEVARFSSYSIIVALDMIVATIGHDRLANELGTVPDPIGTVIILTAPYLVPCNRGCNAMGIVTTITG
jgi:hypothetical protein